MPSRRSACLDSVGGRSVYVECPNHGFDFEQVPNRIMDLRELLAMVLLGVFLGIPEANAQNPIGLSIRDEHRLVNKTPLFFQDWNGLLVDSVCKLFGFS